MLTENLYEIQERVKNACERAGRAPEEVTLIAVSKTKPIEMLSEIYQAGIREFGENKVQELTSKEETMPKDIHWHMIGHLQTNKIKYIVDRVTLIHSVDSIKLAEAIDKEAKKKNVICDVLLEVNVAEEESKFGFSLENVIPALDNLKELSNIRICGLMTIAPFVENPEENRPVFSALKKLSVDIAEKNIDNISVDILSMGMTNDFEVAIEEGATMVRVGTAIFGERQYQI